MPKSLSGNIGLELDNTNEHEHNIKNSERNYDKRYKDGYHGGGLGVAALERYQITKAIFTAYFLKSQNSETEQKHNKDYQNDCDDLVIMDFGCGDGRYLGVYGEVIDQINDYRENQGLNPIKLKLYGTELSQEGLNAFNRRCLASGFINSYPEKEEGIAVCLKYDKNIEVHLIKTSEDIETSKRIIGSFFQEPEQVFDVTIMGFGTSSSMPKPVQDEYYRFISDTSGFFLNMVSSNNFAAFEKEFEELRRLPSESLSEVDKDRLQKTRYPRSYLYRDEKGEEQFYQNMDLDQIKDRASACGLKVLDVRGTVQFITEIARTAKSKENKLDFLLSMNEGIEDFQERLKRIAEGQKRPRYEIEMQNFSEYSEEEIKQLGDDLTSSTSNYLLVILVSEKYLALHPEASTYFKKNSFNVFDRTAPQERIFEDPK